ncbi:MAG: hypothetical protein K2G69_07395, partial [Muribaculaceae bacterium]|nr:hypothetical protein [Muribaculaceae bacterium]
SWGWGPAWGPSYRPGVWGYYPPMASWRPDGNRPAGARPGWSTNTRPGGNYAHRLPSGTNGRRPAATGRPGTVSSNPSASTRPGNGPGVVNNNGRWEYNTSATTGYRKPGSGVVNSGTTTRPATNQSGNRSYNTNSNRSYNTTGNTNSNRSYNYNRNTNSNTRNTGSYSPSRSSGGSFGGGRSTSGGGSRSGGGRGGRR